MLRHPKVAFDISPGPSQKSTVPYMCHENAVKAIQAVVVYDARNRNAIKQIHREPYLSEDNSGKAGSSGEEEAASHGGSTGSDGGRGRLDVGGVARGGNVDRRLAGSRARNLDGLIDDGGNDSGNRGRDGLDRVGGASRDHRGGEGDGGLRGVVRDARVASRGVVDGGGRDDRADGGGDGDGLSDNHGRVTGAVGDGVGAISDGVGAGGIHSRGGHGDDSAGDDSGLGRALGDGRTARGDGDIVGRVDGAVSILTSVGQSGTSNDGGSSETHFD